MAVLSSSSDSLQVLRDPLGWPLWLCFTFMSRIRLFIYLTICDKLVKVSDFVTNIGLFDCHTINMYLCQSYPYKFHG